MYGQKLPDGLIRSGIPYQSGNQDDQPICMDDIIKLWQAHYVMKSAQPGETSSRLEYFFWRIMGNPRLRQMLRESQIARFHAAISRDVPIRTTPRQSPMRTDLRKNGYISQTVDAKFLSDGRHLTDTEKHRADTSVIKASITRDRSTSRPRPILRTPGIDTSHSGKSARILTPTWGSNAKGKLPLRGEMFDIPGSSLKIQSTSPTTLEDGAGEPNAGIMLPESTNASASYGSPSKSPRRGSSFVVSSKRRRPSMPTKRSSQSTSGTSNNSPGPSPTSIRAAPISVQDSPHDQSSLPETTGQQSGVSSWSQLTSSNHSSVSPLINSSIQLIQPGPNFQPTRTAPSIYVNPQMRGIATKSALSTGLSTTSPITASLQPFSIPDASDHLPIRAPAESRNHLTAGTQSDIDVLNRSRENLNQLLQRDRRRSSGQKKGKKP